MYQYCIHAKNICNVLLKSRNLSHLPVKAGRATADINIFKRLRDFGFAIKICFENAFFDEDSTARK